MKTNNLNGNMNAYNLTSNQTTEVNNQQSTVSGIATILPTITSSILRGINSTAKDERSLREKCLGPAPGVEVVIRSICPNSPGAVPFLVILLVFYIKSTDMKTTDIIIHSILVIMMFITLGIFIDHIMYLKKYIKKNYKRRRMSMLLAGMPPVFTTTACVGTFFPQGNLMIDFVCSVYFGVAMHTLLNLMVNYYGGVTAMVERLNNKPIRINTMPLCCLCFCFPTFQMSKKNFRVLYYATLQAALSRPVVLFFRGVFVLDTTFSVNEMVFMFMLMISMLTGMWALVILRLSSQKLLAKYNITAKFFTFQSVLLISNLQPFIIKLVSLPCIPPHTTVGRILILNYELIVVEFFIISFVMNCLYRRKTDGEELGSINGSLNEQNDTNDQLIPNNHEDSEIRIKSTNLNAPVVHFNHSSESVV